MIINLTTTTASGAQALAGGQPGPQGIPGPAGIAAGFALGVNPRSTASYTFTGGDLASTVQFSFVGAIAATLPTMTNGWWTIVKVLPGAGPLTITPSGTIDGASTLVVGSGRSYLIYFDSSNFQSTGPIAFTADTGTAGVAGFAGFVPAPPAGAFNRNYALFANSQWLPMLARGFLSGCGLANDGTTPNTIIDIAAGVAFSDDFDTMIVLNSAITKSISSTWAVGSGNGGLDTGSVASSTWYHIYVITRLDTGVDDALISLSASSPTMPTNYTKKRRIGSIKTDASSHILAFTQIGDEFLWKNPPYDIQGVATPTSQASITLTVPTGVSVWALCTFRLDGTGTNMTYAAYPVDIGAQGANSWWTNSVGLKILDSAQGASELFTRIRTNTSAQINHIGDSNTGSLRIATFGWMDRRGQDG